MDIVLAMLADNAAKKIGEKKWDKFPYSMERHAKENESVQNYALYHYIMKNAMRYPQEWVINGYGAKALAKVCLSGKEVELSSIEILQKTGDLSDEIVQQEVTKTFSRASEDFPALRDSDNISKDVCLVFPLEWKSVGA
ncbi:hypothetical protein XJ32_04070 [Helicobacter bilis]|uniref:Uncharacterized protein n=1 Tax=Helicobacter bilis TaxID=37372 RepID=A0A1Q2LHE7_9HELI|nr:hypothetical protein [Helicobacter bilis]AQQ59402.1 hypothetical protein XJ32_04070 [Helicobacter bilis]